MSSKKEICVGHAIGFFNGHTVLKEGDGFEGWYTKDDKEILDEIVSTDFEGSESSFRTFFVQNIQAHSTIICFLVHQGRGLVWYYNPWGLQSDKRHYVIETFWQWDDDIGEDATSAIENHAAEFKQWARDLAQLHIMFKLQAMKLNAAVDKLEIVNPLDSLPDVGPQHGIFGDGIVDQPWIERVRDTVYECSGRRGGSCAVWSTMYKTLVSQIMSKLIHEQRSLEYIRRFVTSQMKKGVIQHLNPLESIGILTYAETKAQKESEILLKVFDLLPELSEIHATPNSMNSSYHREARIVHKDVSLALKLENFNNLRKLQQTEVGFLGQPDQPDISSRESLTRYFLRKVTNEYDPLRHDSKIHEIVRQWETKSARFQTTEYQNASTSYFLHYVMLLIHCKTSRAYTVLRTENLHGYNTRGIFAHQLRDAIADTRKRLRESSENLYAGRTRQRLES